MAQTVIEDELSWWANSGSVLTSEQTGAILGYYAGYRYGPEYASYTRCGSLPLNLN